MLLHLSALSRYAHHLGETLGSTSERQWCYRRRQRYDACAALMD
jgi:hypothetical protein